MKVFTLETSIIKGIARTFGVLASGVDYVREQAVYTPGSCRWRGGSRTGTTGRTSCTGGGRSSCRRRRCRDRTRRGCAPVCRRSTRSAAVTAARPSTAASAGSPCSPRSAPALQNSNRDRSAYTVSSKTRTQTENQHTHLRHTRTTPPGAVGIRGVFQARSPTPSSTIT